MTVQVNRFVPRRHSDIADLIAAYPLAWVVSEGDAGHESTPLPLLAETDGDGRIVSLFGHFALRNPQVRALERRPRATFLFQGPQAYVSPRLVSQPQWGPTWNYAVVKFEGEVTFVPDETEASVRQLTDAMEAGADTPWQVEQLGERYDQLIRHIIAFRATVGEPNARFKLGQDERPSVFDDILANHPDAALTDWMRRTK